MEGSPSPQGAPRVPTDVQRCVIDALATGRVVHLSVTYPTVEGDPITEFFQTNEDGTVRIVTDNRRDKNARGGILTLRCEALVEGQPAPEGRDCN